MVANVNTYIGRQAAWHRLGTVTGRHMTWEEIASLGNLNWKVVKKQLTHPESGAPIPAWGTFRTDNNEFLGTVGAGYTPIPHTTGFKLIDHIMKTQDGAHYETAGALGRGEVVWGLADLNMNFRTTGDDMYGNYLLFVTSHDSQYPFMVRLANVRVVCQNTLNMALGQKAQNAFRVRHTRNWEPRVEDALTILDEAKDRAKDLEDTLKRLSRKQVTRETVATVLDRLFPSKDGKLSAKTENNIMSILKKFESNDNNAVPALRGTALNFLNAFTEFADHGRPTKLSKKETENRSPDQVTELRDKARATSALLGSGADFKAQALRYILDVEGNMREISEPVSVSVPALPAQQTIDLEPTSSSRLLDLVAI